MGKSNASVSDERDFLKYKLTNLWGVMQRSGKNGFVCKDDFIKWAKTSGYKPWKSLTLIDEADSYSENNCVWTIDKRFSKEVVSVKEDDTQRNVCRTIKSCVGNLEENKINLLTSRQLLENLVESKRLANRTVVKDTLKDLDKALMNVKSCLSLIDKLDIIEDNK